MTRFTLVYGALILGLVLAASFLLTRYDRCNQCGNWYGPGVPHHYRHIAVPTYWKK